jgi:cysteine desulfurase
MSSPRPTPIYLDYNATTPVLPEVVDAMRACYEGSYLNPASQHEFGRGARRLLENARYTIAHILGAEVDTHAHDRLIFTSGGTEANNLAIRGLLELGRVGIAHHKQQQRDESVGGAHPAPHLIVSAIEHPSIATLANELEHRGYAVDRLGVDRNGVVRVDELARLIRPETRLVAVMLANNETGVVQPIADLAQICNEHHIPLHTDAAQAAGKIPVNFRDLKVVSMSVAAHKFHGPTGIGALVVRHGIELAPQLFGGFQQFGMRPGTESVALAVGMSRALELWNREAAIRDARMRNLRDGFEQSIVAGWPAAVVIGAAAERLPHTSHIAFVGIDRQALFMALDQAKVACSTGSACASGSSEPSPVLVAMGCQPAIVASALRFSCGATTTASEVDQAVHRILACCNDLGRQKRA